MLQTLSLGLMTETFPGLAEPAESIDFEPTRMAGLRRLERFAARTGRHYARTRNFDFGPARRSNVSALSPWLRHRLVTEEEVLARVLAAQGATAAEKFIQEVFWRTYFKGWLEQRPSVWDAYQRCLLASLRRLESDTALNAAYRDALSGRTGIDCFDHWAKELVSVGYLHNHARMWMASIWIFTLRLPWELGADFFLRHLLDGDPASNTLGWRWVAGLHTRGKTYLARPDNIEKYTEGRFRPQGLASIAEPLTENTDHPRVPVPAPRGEVSGPYLLLLTEDDLDAARLMPAAPAGAIGLLATQGRAPGPLGAPASLFAAGAMDSALEPFGGAAQTGDDWGDLLIEAAARCGVKAIATAYCPLGSARARLDRAEPHVREAGISLYRVMRPYDRCSWPHAKAGFFGLRKKIPLILRDVNLPH